MPNHLDERKDVKKESLGKLALLIIERAYTEPDSNLLAGEFLHAIREIKNKKGGDHYASW
jgi:hypothetical protein